jgi:cytochrome P450
MIPVAVDPPEHAHFRQALAPFFAPRAIASAEEELRRQVGELIDAFLPRGEAEIVRDLARPFPVQVFLTLFGLPLDDRDRLLNWVYAILTGTQFASEGASSEKKEASEQLTQYLLEFFENRRRNPEQDMISHVLTLPEGQAWTDDEVLGFAYLFTLAGLDTVTSTIGFVIQYLATHDEVRRQVVADPDLVDVVIEEIIRLETAAPQLPRTTTQDVEVHGTVIPAGSPVVLVAGAANRDPARYPSPDDVDLSQSDLGHLTFGSGPHRCIGSHLARRELRILVDELHKRIPDYSLAPGAKPEVAWPQPSIRLSSLPIVFPAAGAK